LRKAVAARLGYDPFFPTAPKTVIAQVTHAPGGYRGRVQIIGESGDVRGERDLASTGDDCREIVTTMALAISIALDDLDEAAPAAPPAPAATVTPDEPPPDPPPPRDEPVPTPPAPPAPRAKRVDLRLSAGPVMSIGTAPSAALGASAAAWVGYGAIGARLDLRGELPSSGSATPRGRVATSTVLAALSGCVRGSIPFACVGAGAGWLSSQTDEIARPASDGAPFGALLARVGADVSLGRLLYVEPLLEGGLNLTPLHVAIDGARAFTLPVASATVAVHLGAHFF
jgi:hypothetical protein